MDTLLWDRGIRARAADVAAASVLRGARDSAALEGADMPMDDLVSGRDASPLDRAGGAAIDVVRAIPGQAEAWQRSTLQVLAHLHLIASHSFASSEERGRPRSSEEVVDPLHVGPPPPVADVAPRLDALADVLTSPTAAPAIVVAAIAHGELLALRPFRWGSGLIARAAVRLVIASRGLDPDLLSCPEAGMLDLGRTSYVAALRAYESGEPEGLARWIEWNATTIGFGAALSLRGEA